MTQSTAKRNKLIINLLIISAFVVILNETVMGMAIPHLMADLGITALAPGFEVLLLGRIVQAAGTAIGPTISGLILSHLSWRFLFAFVLPIAITMLIVPLVVGVLALAAFILLPLYMQNVLGLTVLQSGLLLLPGGFVMGLLAPFVGRTYDKVGPRPLLLAGTVLTSLALWGLRYCWMYIVRGYCYSLGTLSLVLGWRLYLHHYLRVALGHYLSICIRMVRQRFLQCSR